ncbi:4MPY, histidine kinase-group I protein [Sclerotinia borealis F-4128]|uniref:4MPY, histidine kinase-group I protein n=1 Tax=Sclerotinia borealis (strain F-4128) TaxID=1432307 RepID=W9CP94_SCLBF|nr:4MPY, histidine kinase-group I protein [Sclerotinia borealis F-4128]
MLTKPGLDTPIKVSEVQRVREVYRYLPPFAASLIPQPKQNGEHSESPKVSPKAFSSSDRALNAFAQLGALRLRARRVMISLVDRTHEYILAESTRTLSSQDDDVHEAGDSLWMGVRTIPRQESLCDAIINTLPSKGKRKSTEFRPKVIPKVINDLANDETLKYDPNIIGGPKIRFVATVPIRSRQGFDIGAYSVFDDIPRNGLEPEELEFLTDITDTVMEHLENIAVKRDHQRGEKMVKGLGLFVEGHSSIKSWWLRTRTDRETSVRGKDSYTTVGVGNFTVPAEASNTKSEKFSTEANLSFVDLSRGLDVPMSPLPTSTLPSTILRNDISIRLQGENDQPLDNSSIRAREGSLRLKEKLDQPTALNSLNSSSNISPALALNETSKTPSLKCPDEAHLSTTGQGIPTNEPTTRNLSDKAGILRRMLSRASNLIRESTDVEGVIFFDTEEGGFGSQGHQSSLIKPDRNARLHGSARVSSSEDDQRTSSRNSTSDSSSGKGLEKESKKEVQGSQTRMCEVLAYSTASSCTLHGDPNLQGHLSVTENFVRRLFKRHPHGKIYAFDADGHMSSSEEDINGAAIDGEISFVTDGSQSPSMKKAPPKSCEGQTILKIFPGARFVMILPLWDSQRERWFASTMLWTSDPTRVLSLDNDLNYVAAFGNSIMAEASRLDIVASDQTKTALISSISHEIRSPLHAVAGSIELLQDTQMSKYQKDVVDTIGHCSTTLLDTLNNVLDYAKINNFTTSQKSEQRAIRKSSRIRKAVPAEKFQIYGTISLTTDLDIASITEDVINGIYAGHVYVLQSTSTVSTDIDHPISPTKSDIQGMVGTASLSVILDVDHKSNWTFLTQPGAWKRILMNIFGNALKYTTSGLVKVGLSYKAATSSNSRMNQAFVTLTISDTGQGIAEDFLKRQIYTPFAQENSLTPGAGLGLSIVRQIVGALDGKIEVFSIQGTGTVVKVVLKLEKSQSQIGEKPLMSANILQAKTFTNSLELVLIGMETSTPESDKIANAKSKHYGSVGPAISRMSRNWFGMKTSEATGFDAATGDIFLVTSERFYEMEESWKTLYTETTSSSRKRHVIVLTESAKSERRTFIGPKKMADCFLSIFDRSGGDDGNRSLAMPLNLRRTTYPAISARDSSPPRLLNTDAVVSDKPIALLVEDNPINMKLLVACIKKLGMQYYCAVNGQEAVSHYKKAKKKPEVIFMDISMPVMNGFEASQRIRRFEKEENLNASVIVAVTGLASDESQMEAYNSGINLFMSKPVPLKVLSKIVVDLEENRRVSGD